MSSSHSFREFHRGGKALPHAPVTVNLGREQRMRRILRRVALFHHRIALAEPRSYFRTPWAVCQTRGNFLWRTTTSRFESISGGCIRTNPRHTPRERRTYIYTPEKSRNVRDSLPRESPDTLNEIKDRRLFRNYLLFFPFSFSFLWQLTRDRERKQKLFVFFLSLLLFSPPPSFQYISFTDKIGREIKASHFSHLGS